MEQRRAVKEVAATNSIGTETVGPCRPMSVMRASRNSAPATTPSGMQKRLEIDNLMTRTMRQQSELTPPEHPGASIRAGNGRRPASDIGQDDSNTI